MSTTTMNIDNKELVSLLTKTIETTIGRTIAIYTVAFGFIIFFLIGMLTILYIVFMLLKKFEQLENKYNKIKNFVNNVENSDNVVREKHETYKQLYENILPLV